jgi:uncharacterized protein (DUF2141 family)
VAPATINVSATASDSDGSIARVQFYSGATILATVTAAPYTFAWTNVQAGTYTLTAVAQDDKGASSTSAASTITVSAPNQPPSVSLTSPANGATFSAPATITVSASASDTDGTVSKVDFFAGTTLIGTDTSSPYGITWSNVTAGSYALTAVATDNAGATTTSAARTITVTGLPAPWQQTDIGSPSSPGGGQYANGTFTIDGRGILWTTPDQFHYVYQPFSGDVSDGAHRIDGEHERVGQSRRDDPPDTGRRLGACVDGWDRRQRYQLLLPPDGGSVIDRAGVDRVGQLGAARAAGNDGHRLPVDRRRHVDGGGVDDIVDCLGVRRARRVE